MFSTDKNTITTVTIRLSTSRDDDRFERIFRLRRGDSFKTSYRTLFLHIFLFFSVICNFNETNKKRNVSIRICCSYAESGPYDHVQNTYGHDRLPYENNNASCGTVARCRTTRDIIIIIDIAYKKYNA